MPPQPRRAAPDRNLDEIIHLAFTHATKLGNFVAILKEGKLAPSKLHHAESESFFAQGFKVGYTSWETHNSDESCIMGQISARTNAVPYLLALPGVQARLFTVEARGNVLISPEAQIRKGACTINEPACG